MSVFRTAYVYVRNNLAGVLCETAEGSSEYVLSPAYDLLPVNANMPADKEQFALPMNGKKPIFAKRTF